MMAAIGHTNTVSTQEVTIRPHNQPPAKKPKVSDNSQKKPVGRLRASTPKPSDARTISQTYSSKSTPKPLYPRPPPAPASANQPPSRQHTAASVEPHPRRAPTNRTTSLDPRQLTARSTSHSTRAEVLAVQRPVSLAALLVLCPPSDPHLIHDGYKSCRICSRARRGGTCEQSSAMHPPNCPT